MKISVFDPKFLAVFLMKERNLAYELLKKLIDDQIRGYRSKSVTRLKKVFELMQGMVNGYLNGQPTNAEVFEEMLKMAQRNAHGKPEGRDLGLTGRGVCLYKRSHSRKPWQIITVRETY